MGYKTLKDIAAITMGQSPDSSSYNKEGKGIPFYQGNADFGELYPTTRVWCSNPKKTAKENDILISVRAPIGALNYATEKCCIGRGLAAITIENDFERNYVFHLLKAKNNELNNKGAGSTFKAIGKSVLEEVQVPVISAEQQEISMKLMDTIEQIIHQRKRELQKLDELIKARFVELFGDPVSNPHRYPKVQLSELAEIKIGPFGSLLHKEDYITNGHALVNPSHIVDGNISVDDKLTVSDEKFSELSAYHLQIGDVVMGRRGEMGRCAVVQTNGLLCGTGSLLIRTKGDVTADYLQKIISFPSFKKTIEDMAVGQTMPNLNVPIVSKFQIIKPPIEVQKAYYAFAAQIDKSKVAVQKALDQTQLLFDSLMQKYFG